MFELTTQFDSAKSFYGKAMVKTIRKNFVSKDVLYSYGTKVAEVCGNKAVVFGTYSQTTLRHIKEFLKQNGFPAISKAQIVRDYMV